MSNTQIDLLDDVINPLDCVEEVLSAHNWVFNRMNDDELIVQVAGKGCDYRIFFIWQEDMNALQFCCQYDLVIASDNYESAARALMSINENLWMGHFDIPRDTGTPSFRHTCLFRGTAKGANAETIEDLVDISMVQCERFFPLFSLLASNAASADEQNLSLALMETQGES